MQVNENGPKHYDFPGRVLQDIIRKAIEEGFLYEFLFTENGRRLWANYPEKYIKRLIREELRRNK